MKTKPNIHDTLTADGWRCVQSPNYTRASCYYYKRFKTPSRCLCNSDKDGIQVIVYQYDKQGLFSTSYEIEICGEYSDDLWCKLQSYSITEYDLLLVLPAAIKKLLAAWEAMAGCGK